MLKAVIFDLNGLFVRSKEYLSRRLEREYGVNHDEFVRRLDHVLDQARRSKLADTWPLWEPELQKFGLKFTKEQFWQYWFSQEQEDPEMLQLAKDLKARGLKVFILTNNFAERAKFYEDHFSFARLHEAVDKIYFSYQTGFVKPDPQAWLNILQKNNLKPEECLFFDNSQRNVDAANKLGIKSFVFESAEQVKRHL